MIARSVRSFGAIALLACCAHASAQQLHVGTCLCNWDNGDYDSAGGQLSVQDADGTLVAGVADDFFLQPGKLHRLDTVYALLFTDDQTPDAVLELYTDCNGKPDALIGAFSATGAFDTGVDKDELNLWEFAFDTNACRLEGGQMYWVTVRGIRNEPGEGGEDAPGAEEYQFATAGNSVVQGVQGQFLLPPQGFDDWTPIDQTNLGKTDFAFSVCSTPSDILYDGGDADFLAEYNLAVSQALPNYRAADDFSLPPCAAWHIDTVRACLLTNCDITTLEAEVYATDPVTCMPVGPALFTASNPKVTPLGVSVPTVEVVPMSVDAYRVDFADLAWHLEGGQTYWIALVAEGTGNFRDRTFVCYAYDCNKDANCQIKASPAKFYKPSVGAWEGFGSFLADGIDRQLAITISGSRPITCDDPNQGEASACPCDFNNDGSLNDQDFFDFANAYLGTDEPDYNHDGFFNDQDWFDFVNCYLSPPGACTRSTVGGG